MPISLRKMVQQQVAQVLKRGQRFERFDQIRQRHFWSNYFFPYGAGGILSGPYELFKVIASQNGQGYPAGVTLTERETNWRGNGRVPDNQNFVISEIGVSLIRPPEVNLNNLLTIPANGIWANIPLATQADIDPNAPIHPTDAYNILNGIVLEMGFLTNNVPLGLLADFSQSSGVYSQTNDIPGALGGDPTNGVPSAAFRRKLEVPILLQHGEAMGMRLNVLRNIPTVPRADGGAGWVEIRVDWWATESFVELS